MFVLILIHILNLVDIFSNKLCHFSSYTPLALFDNLLALMTNTSLILNFDVHLSILKVMSELFIGESVVLWIAFV